MNSMDKTYGFNDFGGNHGRYEGQERDHRLDLTVAVGDFFILVTHEVEEARGPQIWALMVEQEAEEDDLVEVVELLALIEKLYLLNHLLHEVTAVVAE